MDKATQRANEKVWRIPECAKHVAHLVNNTGGNDVEELMNRKVVPGSNDVVASMQITTGSQFALIERLRHYGYLRKALDPVDFEQLRAANVTRSEQCFFPVKEWTPTDWATAMAGECGEACNLIKKNRRGDPVELDAIGDELADVVLYADLLAARLGIDLGQAVRRKFNAVSKKRKSDVRL